EAQAVAEVSAESITYVEAHGTGTALGDPIEVAALTEAFRSGTDKRGYCALGSVKSNIGHLDTAAGIAGLIKTVLALQHRQLPPSLHFQRPNPRIDFDSSPFYVNTQLRPWLSSGPRLAGVSSFGMGGTNAHLVLQEAPPAPAPSPSRPSHLLVLSARSQAALHQAASRLASHLQSHPDLPLADVAFTLQQGRRHFPHRLALACNSTAEALSLLQQPHSPSVARSLAADSPPSVAFLFPGQGSQYVRMAAGLFSHEPVFRDCLSRCDELLRPHLPSSLLLSLYPPSGQEAQADALLAETWLTQPALFSVEYALAQLWLSWGVQPSALLGHSIGEYVAACLAGVFRLEDALALVAARGRLMHSLPPGAMLSVPLPESELLPLLSSTGCDLAAVNAPSSCVASGSPSSISSLESLLRSRGLSSQRLHTSHAFHSSLLEPILDSFLSLLSSLPLQPPRLPVVSNLSGSWLSASQATSPLYWVRQLRSTVRFSDGLSTLLSSSPIVLLEVGPGHSCSTLARLHPSSSSSLLLSSGRHPNDPRHDCLVLLSCLAHLWALGLPISWPSFSSHESRRRLPLPPYPFQSLPFWLSPSGTRHRRRSEPAVLPSTPQPVLADTPDAPQSGSEALIARVWRELLGVARLGRHDNFFELGGHSLLAIQVITAINREAGTQLASHALLGAPTVAALAGALDAALAQRDPAASSAPPLPLLELQRGESRRLPLFLVHPVGGNVYFYRELVSALGPELPVYAFQARGLEENTEPLNRVEDLAATYLQALLRFRPRGPYALGGASFGGAVAYEMARRLRASGEEVHLLALLDTPGPGQMPPALEDEAAILASLSRSAADDALSVEVLRALSPEERLHRVLEKQKELGRLSPDTQPEQLRRVVQVFKANMDALFAYVPGPYPGLVTYFLAEERRPHEDPPRPDEAWSGRAAGGLLLHRVSGNHLTMNAAPHVATIARHLRTRLSESPPAPVTGAHMNESPLPPLEKQHGNDE
ncbi:MAG: type I polyketide synthase, partial [Archangium sp.]